MKIALIHASDSGGGAERCVVDLHVALRELGHASTLYVGAKHTDIPYVEEIPHARGVPGLFRLARTMEYRMGWQQLYAPSFRHLAQTLDPHFDVVHIHTLWGAGGYGDLGALPGLSRRFPVVITLHEQWLTTGHCACPFDCRRWREGCGQCPDLTLAPAIRRDGTGTNWARKRRCLRKTRAHVTTVSNWLNRVVVESPIFTGKTISTVYNGINDRVFCPGSKDGARNVLGLPAEHTVILLAGQTVDGILQHIAQHAVQALNRLQREKTTVLIVGRYSDRLAPTLKLPVKMLPFQQDQEGMARCYQAADMTVISSEFESFGRIAAESQACGTPVVTFDSGGLPEVVKHGLGGIVVPRGDTDALHAAVVRLLDDVAARNRLGKNAVDWASQNFSMLTVAAGYLRVYETAVNAIKGPPPD